MKITLFLIIFLIANKSLASLEAKDLDIRKNADFQHNAKDDFLTSLGYLTHGAYHQFTDNTNLYLIASATTFFLATNQLDKTWSKKLTTKRTRDTESLISDVGIIINTPIVPLTTYYIARNTKDEKLLKFSQEYFAAHNLALIQTAAISLIPIHKRPTPDNLNIWEKNFRYESSFPSGHTIGWWIMSFKSYQYYGLTPAIPSASLAIITAVERVKTNKHYLSDTLGSVLVSFLASRGVEKAANPEKESSLSRLIDKYRPQIGIIKEGTKQGLLMSVVY